jgi:uncharacterized protein
MADKEPTSKLVQVAQKAGEAYVLTLKAPADNTKLFLEAKRVDNAPPDSIIGRADIDELIRGLVDASLLHQEVLDDIVQQLAAGHEIEQRRIAKARLPADGKDGKLLLLVKKYSARPGEPPEIVDPHFIHHFDNIEKGLVVGRIYPPTDGVAGIDVFGKPIAPKPGKPADMKLDTTITARPGSSYQELVAAEAGYLSEDRGVLAVKTEMIVAKNLDFKIGDIDFVGSVKVRGNVGKDFVIRARRDIEISGDVNQGRLESVEGKVIVKGAIVGERDCSLTVTQQTSSQMVETQRNRPRADIKAKAGVIAGRIENAVVESGGDIEVTRECRSCLLRTRQNVMMPAATLIAGEVFAVCGVDAKLIGNERGSKTVVHICSDVESSSDYATLANQISSHEAAEQLLILHLGPFAVNPKRVVRLETKHRQKTEQLLKKLESVKASSAKLKGERENLLKSAQLNNMFRVSVRQQIFPGIEIHRSGRIYDITEAVKGPATLEFLPGDDECHITELRPLECIVGSSCSTPDDAEKKIPDFKLEKIK